MVNWQQEVKDLGDGSMTFLEKKFDALGKQSQHRKRFVCGMCCVEVEWYV